MKTKISLFLLLSLMAISSQKVNAMDINSLLNETELNSDSENEEKQPTNPPMQHIESAFAYRSYLFPKQTVPSAQNKKRKRIDSSIHCDQLGCLKVFNNQSQFDKHLNEDHAILDRYTCKQCEKCVDSKKRLSQHISMVHGTEKTKVLCNQCNQFLPNKKDLNKHQQYCGKQSATNVIDLTTEPDLTGSLKELSKEEGDIFSTDNFKRAIAEKLKMTLNQSSDLSMNDGPLQTVFQKNTPQGSGVPTEFKCDQCPFIVYFESHEKLAFHKNTCHLGRMKKHNSFRIKNISDYELF